MDFEAIRTRIDEAVKFSEAYPEALRPVIVGHLLASNPGTTSSSKEKPSAKASEKEIAVTGSLTQRAASSSGAPTLGEDSEWFSRLARELDVPADKLRDVYDVTDDGNPRVRAILQDDSLPKRQIGYALLHLVASEIAGRQVATSDEIRELVQKKKTYDTGNFTRNFKAAGKKLRPYGNPGQGNTEWVLTSVGREDGRRLIKELCSAEPR